METTPSHKRFREFSLRNEFWANFEVKCLTQEFQKNRVWTGLQSKGDFSFSVALILIPLVGIIISGQEMRAVAISKVGHKMQNFAEGLEHKINTFSWPIKGSQVIRSKDQAGD
ncbi:hypothetical protein QL285_010188 [Trifolium repens]|nr:hypothetical protein QL285_010188 [Trifolium repens]